MKVALNVTFETIGEAARWLAKYTTTPQMPVYDLLKQEFPESDWNISPEIAKAAIQFLAKHFQLELK